MAAQREPSIVQRSLAEVVGTFLLVFIGAGAATSLLAVFDQVNPGALLLVALAHGLALLLAVYTIGKISGAHVNPAVSIALASVGKLAWVDAIFYIIAQLIGATLGALGVLVVFGRDQALAAGVGATTFNPVVTHPIQAAAIEAFGAFILVLAIVSTVADKRSPAGWAGLVIGFALAAVIMVAGMVTGASVNPARTFGPDIVLTLFGGNQKLPGGATIWGEYWVYVVGPIVGGVVAAWAYRFIARPDLAERAERPATSKPAAQPATTKSAAAAKVGARRR